jgi:hypothetical protein
MIAASLLQNSSVASLAACLISSKNDRSQAMCCPALLSPMYSDSVDDNDTIDCILLDQAMAPLLLMKMYPEVDREVL